MRHIHCNIQALQALRPKIICNITPQCDREGNLAPQGKLFSCMVFLWHFIRLSNLDTIKIRDV